MKNHMKKWITLIMMAMIGISASLFISGCEKDSGLEEAAEDTQEAVEDATEDAAEGIEDAAEEVDDQL